MKIDIISRNYTPSEHLKDITEQKLAKLDKYFSGEEANCKVYFKKENNAMVTELMLNYEGKMVRAQVSSDNFYDNLDVILPKVEGQIRKHRTKFDKDRKNSAFIDFAMYGETDKDKQSKLVKEKRFTLRPMTIEEAIEEMDLLGHSFFVFKDLKTNTIQILYKRNDGDLGLIQPE